MEAIAEDTEPNELVSDATQKFNAFLRWVDTGFPDRHEWQQPDIARRRKLWLSASPPEGARLPVSPTAPSSSSSAAGSARVSSRRSYGEGVARSPPQFSPQAMTEGLVGASSASTLPKTRATAGLRKASSSSTIPSASSPTVRRKPNADRAQAPRSVSSPARTRAKGSGRAFNVDTLGIPRRNLELGRFDDPPEECLEAVITDQVLVRYLHIPPDSQQDFKALARNVTKDVRAEIALENPYVQALRQYRAEIAATTSVPPMSARASLEQQLSTEREALSFLSLADFRDEEAPGPDPFAEAHCNEANGSCSLWRCCLTDERTEPQSTVVKLRPQSAIVDPDDHSEKRAPELAPRGRPLKASSMTHGI
uniref:Uncharacterized protein n=1 Tax=Noctiluca scintillans TaxID=2966 RepID=A0A7S1AIN9_NOCSC|mmetsp:Transcript_47956/g.127016  ORF Transcript_47956/g.127016 Transcript_47956/m.127016 type:complete len:366 (+) Transcript_47956:91-1188(+)